MAGLLIDISVIVIVAAFGWVGASLGLVRSSIRLIAAIGALLLAVLLRAPLGGLVEKLSPASEDFSNLVAMLAVGVGAYIALASLASYYATWKPHDELVELNRWLGAIPGALLGAAWSAVMVALIILLPSSNPVTLAAIQSRVGGAVIEGAPAMLQRLRTSFPHYTQTLPKGELGAVTKATDEDLPIRLTSEPRDRREQAGVLLGNINAYRKKNRLPELQWNLEVASAARRHSRGMLEDRYFGYTPPDGGLNFEDRMKSALGNNTPLYNRFAEQVAWSPSVANAYAALVRDSDARELLLDEDLSEVGIGVASGGFFNGSMFSIGFLGRADGEATPAVAAAQDQVTDPFAEEQSPTAEDPIAAPGSTGARPVPPPAAVEPVPPGDAGEPIPPGASGIG